MHDFVGAHQAPRRRQLFNELAPAVIRPVSPVNPAHSPPSDSSADTLTPQRQSTPNSSPSTPPSNDDTTTSDTTSVDTPLERPERPVDTTPTPSSSSSSSSRTTSAPTTQPTAQPTLPTTSSSSSLTVPTTTRSSSSLSVAPTTTAPASSSTSIIDTAITSAPTPTSFQTVTSTDGTGGIVTVVSTIGGAQPTGELNGSQSGSDVNIGAIIGGLAGGVAGLIILVYLVLLPIRKRAQKKREIEWLAFEADHHNDNSAAAVYGRGATNASSSGHGLKANSSVGGSIEAAAYGMSEVGHAAPDVNRADSYGHGGQAGVGAGLYTHLDQGSATWQQQQQQQSSPVAGGGYDYGAQPGYEGYYGGQQSTELGYYHAPSPEQQAQHFRGSPAQQNAGLGYSYSVNAGGAPQLSHSNSYNAGSAQQSGLARQPSEIMAAYSSPGVPRAAPAAGQWAETTATSPYTSSPQTQATRQRPSSRTGSIDSRREAEAARGGLHVVNDN